MNKKATIDELAEMRDAQIAIWPLAKENYSALGKVKGKTLNAGDLTVTALHNPARIKSTGASVDRKSIAERPCFLCKANRPPQQLCDTILPGWDFIVNPYPILPLHFTIVSTTHQPQEGLPAVAAEMAEKMPGMVVFFNGARAGASAPDHLHLQAVMASELPLIRITEQYHHADKGGIISSDEFGLDLPFSFFSAVIPPTESGMTDLLRIMKAKGVDRLTGIPDAGLVNSFIWIDSAGMMRAVAVPRAAHRPSCYFAEGDDRLVISPGALDMAGLPVVPRRKDFERLTDEDILRIYSEVGWKSR